MPAGALDRYRIVLFSLWFLIFAALVASPDPAMAQGTVTVTSVTSEAWDDPDLAADEEGARLLFTIHRTSIACCTDNDIVVSISESGGDMVPWTTKTIRAYDIQGFTSFKFAVYTVNDNEIEPDTTITMTIAPRSNYTVGTPSSQSITIRDNDSLSTPSEPRAKWEHREDGVLVSWETPSSTGSSAITRYEYRRRVYGDNWSRTWTSLPVSTRALLFNNLGHQAKYELDIRAVNGAGGGGIVRIRDLVWLRVPSPPGFRAEPGDATGTVKVSVSSGPTALGVGGYEMRWKRSDSSWDTVEPSALGDGWKYFRLGDGLYAIVGAAGFGSKLDPGVSYDFEVRSRSQHPSKGTIYSPTASASAVAKEKPVGPFVPGSVKFSMGKPAGGKVTVAWEPPEDGGSEILRYQARKRSWAKDSGGNPTNPRDWTSSDAGDGTASARRHQFTSLSACGIYDFGIRAVNAVGNGPWDDLRVDLPGSSGSSCAAREPTLEPIKPQDLTATPKSTSRIDLSWWWYNPEGRATSIQVQRSTTSNGPWTTKADWVTSSLDAYTDTGLTGDTLYYYRVRGRNGVGTGPWSHASATTWSADLGKVESLVARRVSNSRIDLSWSEASGGATGYEIDRGVRRTCNCPWKRLGLVTEYSDTNLVSNTRYQYQVRAVKDSVKGAWSDKASASTMPAPQLSASSVGASRIDLSWTSLDRKRQYNVQWSADGSNGSWQRVDPAHSGTSTGYSDTGLAAGTTRHYRVQGKLNRGGTWSNVASATTTGTQTQTSAPAAPENISARATGESSIEVSWTAPEGSVTGYKVEWSEDASSWQGVEPPHSGTTTEYTHADLEPDTGYIYRVRALDGDVEGDWSNMAGTNTPPEPDPKAPDAPENVSASASGSSRIDLSWTAPEGEPTSYNVEWSPDGQPGTWRPVDPAHDGAATEYGHTGLDAETAYHYRVRAVNDDGPGEWSVVASATTEAATQQRGEPPAAPGNVSASASGQSRIEVSWSAPKGEVTGYEVEWSADGSGSWTAADPAHSGTATGYSDTGLDAGTTRHYRVRAVNGAGSGEWSGPASATTERPELTARFEQAPAEHQGPDSTFTLRLVFSEAVAASYRNLRDHAITATNGAVRKSERVNGSSAEWNVTVAPSSREAVTVSVSGGSDACSQGDAVCTEDGRRLSNSPSVTVEGPPAVPLTAELDGVPGEHDGESTFTFGLTFSEEPRVSYRTLRDEAFDVDGGAVRNARRRQSGSDLSWEITVEPSSHRDVSIRLPETGSCSASGAICTGDGRPLSHALSASVRGPAAMSVSDARVEEAAGAAVAFAVTLSRAASDRVTVDYRTRDGSAQAGEDYEAASGTLTFSAGASTKTIEVGVLDDAHDEGEETFTLALSNPSGAWLEDAEATGTIENTDLMPAALLARFGRATAEQVVEHVAERMAAPRERGFRARFAGRELRPGMERDFALGFLSQFGQPTGMGPGGAVPMGTASMGATSRGANPMAANLFGRGTGTTGMTGRQPPMGVGAAMPGGPSGGAHGGGFGSFLPGGDLFSNSEFELNREQHGGVVSVWSRSSRSYFGGMEGALSLNGDVRTTMLGADYRRGALTVGLSVGRTLGLGGYGGPSAGQVTSSMTGFYPWLGYQVNDRVSVWGVTGYGTGALSLTPDGAAALETGMSMAMTAAGTRGELIGSRATGGFALAFKADALWVGAATELVDGAAGRLNASAAGVTRVRTALEGSRGFSVGGRVSLTPSVEVGLRQDGGDAETGTGMDVGGGLVFSDSVTGLSLDVRMRTLVVHQADGFSDRGMSLSFGWDPTPSSPLGLTARVAPSWGGSAMGGAEALWRSQMAYGMGSHQMAGSGGQVDAEVGYGLPAGRFVGTPSVGVGTSQYGRDYRLGYRLGLLERGGLDFGLDVSGTRRESIMIPEPDHQVVTSATVTW